MDRFVDYMTTKRGMADALRALIASGGNPYAHSRDRMVAALGLLLAAGSAAGLIRDDVAPEDVLTGLSGVTLAAGDADRRDQAGRLLDLLMTAYAAAPRRRVAPRRARPGRHEPPGRPAGRLVSLS
jgi:hypothetical protein